MKILSHASAKKKKKKKKKLMVLISHFYWAFSSDVRVVKGLILHLTLAAVEQHGGPSEDYGLTI